MDQQRQRLSQFAGSQPLIPAARDHWLTTEQSGREVLRSLIEQWLEHNGWSLAVTSRLAELALLARSSEPVLEWVAGMSLQAGQWVNHRGHVWEAIGTPASEPSDDVPGWRDVSLTSRLHSSGLNLFLRRKSRNLASTFFLELGRLNEWVAGVQAGKEAAPTDQRLRDCVASAHVLGDVEGTFGPEELLSIAIGRLTPEPLVKKQAAAEQQRPPECISGRTLRKAATDAGLDIVEDWAQILELYPGKECERQTFLRQVLLGTETWGPKQVEGEQLATQVLLQRLEDRKAQQLAQASAKPQGPGTGISVD
jgi:hypothetical protein